MCARLLYQPAPLSPAALAAPSKLNAQEHVYASLGLDAELHNAGVSAEELLFAAADGVFEPNLPGLLFIMPWYWENEAAVADKAKRLSEACGVHVKPLRAVACGYRMLLVAWAHDVNRVTDMGLRERHFHPEKWRAFQRTWRKDLRAMYGSDLSNLHKHECFADHNLNV